MNFGIRFHSRKYRTVLLTWLLLASQLRRQDLQSNSTKCSGIQINQMNTNLHRGTARHCIALFATTFTFPCQWVATVNLLSFASPMLNPANNSQAQSKIYFKVVFQSHAAVLLDTIVQTNQHKSTSGF